MHRGRAETCNQSEDIEFPGAAVTKYRRLGARKHTSECTLSVLEAGSPGAGSGRHQGPCRAGPASGSRGRGAGVWGRGCGVGASVLCQVLPSSFCSHNSLARRACYLPSPRGAAIGAGGCRSLQTLLQLAAQVLVCIQVRTVCSAPQSASFRLLRADCPGP